MFIGVDGGGSKNDLILFTQEGNIVHRVIGKGSNVSELGADAACDRLIGQIAGLLENHGGLSAEIDALFAGLSGGGAASLQALVLERLRTALPNARHIRITGDTVTALYAGLGLGDGMAVIAGTGTSEYVRYGGSNYAMVGGWGHLIDDAGSGFWLGKAAINAALRDEDGRGPRTLLTQLVNEKLGRDVRTSIGYLYADGKRTIASFAPIIFAACEAGDEVALGILAAAADELALLITAGGKLIGRAPYRVALVGGLWNAPLLDKAVRARLNDDYILTRLTAPPVLGSALAALELAGCAARDEMREKLIAALKEVE